MATSAYSSMLTEKCSFTWSLDAFSIIQNKTLTSPAFSAVAGSYEYLMTLEPYKSGAQVETKEKKFICISVTLNKKVLPQQISYKIKLMNSKGLKISSIESRSSMFEQPIIIIVTDRQNVLQELDDDVLKIHFDITAFLSMSTTSFRPTTPFSAKMTCGASVLLRDKKLSDFSIRVQDEDIKVHKCILAARSPVFEAMFNSDAKETHLGYVEVTDMEPPTVQAMVEFLYEGEVKDLNVTLALHLLRIGDKYDIVDLVTYCSSYLQSHLCCSNVIEIVIAAYDSNASELQECCIEFMAANSLNTIALSERNNAALKQRNDLAYVILSKTLLKVDA